MILTVKRRGYGTMLGNPLGVWNHQKVKNPWFGEQGRMPDCIKSLKYVQIDGLHPLLGESKQHVEGGVT